MSMGTAHSELSGEGTQHILGVPTLPASAEPGPAALPLPHSPPSTWGQDSEPRATFPCLHPTTGKRECIRPSTSASSEGAFKQALGYFYLVFFFFSFIFYFSHWIWVTWVVNTTHADHKYVLIQTHCGTVQDLLWKTNSEQNRRTEMRNRFPVSQETSKKERDIMVFLKFLIRELCRD